MSEDLLVSLFGSDLKAAIFVVINLVLIESLLSFDNAAALATMVLGLNGEERKKALRYGLLGAYLFRGICLVSASVLIGISWLKALGGLYLLWLMLDHFKDKLRFGELGASICKVAGISFFVFFVSPSSWSDLLSFEWNSLFVIGVKLLLLVYAAFLLWPLVTNGFNPKQNSEQDVLTDKVNQNTGAAQQALQRLIGTFWSTVLLVELMDLAFSVDNVFAAVAFTKHIGLICLGVFIGILSMRFAAQIFILLIDRFPFMTDLAFATVGLLGLKLIFHYSCELNESFNGCSFVLSQNFDLISSIFTMLIFFVPVCYIWAKRALLKANSRL